MVDAEKTDGKAKTFSLWVNTAAIVCILGLFIWFFFLKVSPPASVKGNWIFLPESSDFTDGIVFDDQTHYARWGKEAEGGFKTTGLYSQSGWTLTFTNEFTYWPDGEEMKGNAEILSLSESEMQIRTPKSTFKLKKLLDKSAN